MVNKKKPPKGSVSRRLKKVSGATGAYIQAGISVDEFLSELMFPMGLTVYRKMRRNDPVIGGLMMHLESVPRRLKWRIVTPNNSKKADKAKQIIKESFELFPTGIIGIIGEMCSAFTYGFSVGEIIYDFNEYMDVIANDIEPRHALSIQAIDVKANIIRQTTIEGYFEIPLKKCVIWSINSEARNPFGVSLLRSVYKPYYFKVAIEAAEGVGVDRDLSGLPVLYAPPGFDFTAADPGSPNYSQFIADTLDWATNLVGNIRKDAQSGVVLPDGWELKLLRSEGKSSFDTNKIINRLNSEIGVGLLETFMTGGIFSSTNQANIDTQLNVFLYSINGWAQQIATVLNKQFVDRLCEYNSIPKIDRPKVEPSPAQMMDLKDLASYVARLVANGVITPTTPLEQQLLELADLPYTPDEVKENLEDDKNA